MKKLNKITVLFNKAEDVSLEADTDTQKSAEDVASVLSTKYSVDLLGIDIDQVNLIKNIKSDLVFNLIEWSHARLPNALEAIKLMKQMGLPFTGSDEYGYELSSNKILMKKYMSKYNIPTPKWMFIETGHESVHGFNYPVIVKPSAQHCGIGVGQDSLANSAEELLNKANSLIHKYHEPILVEEFIQGRELHVTVLEKNDRPWVLPPTEIIFSDEAGFVHVLSYDGKWDEQSDEYSKSRAAIADLPKSLLEKVTQVATDCFVKLGGRDYPRLDLRIRGEDVFVLEINNNPGIDYSDESGFGLSGKAAKFTYEEILSHIVEGAYARFQNSAHDTATA